MDFESSFSFLEKNGYFDLAYAYQEVNDLDLSIKYLQKAIKVDPTSKTDLINNEGPPFDKLKKDVRYKELLN